MENTVSPLKNPKIFIYLVIFILLLAASGAFILNLTLKSYTLTPEIRNYYESQVPSSGPKAELFLPSPVEVHILDDVDEIWPDLFNPRYPVKAQKLPALYTKARRMAPLNWVSLKELEVARQRSVLQHSGNASVMARGIRKPEAQEILDESDCSPLMRDLFYRAATYWEDLKPATKSYLERCDSNGVFVRWWNLLDALKAGDSEAIDQASLAFQQGFNHYPGEWSRWFAMEASQWAHVMSQRFQDEAASGKK